MTRAYNFFPRSSQPKNLGHDDTNYKLSVGKPNPRLRTIGNGLISRREKKG